MIQLIGWLRSRAALNVTLRAALAVLAFVLGWRHAPLPAGLSVVWYGLAGLFAGQALAAVTSRRPFRVAGEAITRIAVIAVYWYVALTAPGMPAHTIFFPLAVLVTAFFAAPLAGVYPERILQSLFARICGAGDLDVMAEADARVWSACTTVGEFGLAGSLYLRGLIGSQPAYQPSTSVDEETSAVIDVLSAANQAGFFTDGSQPAVFEDYPLENAWVTGFADAATMADLNDMLIGSGLHFRIRRTCSRRDFHSNARIGWGIMSASDVKSLFDVCSPAGVEALVDAYQIVILDPEPGRDDRLWPLLEQFAASRGITVAADQVDPGDGDGALLRQQPSQPQNYSLPAGDRRA